MNFKVGDYCRDIMCEKNVIYVISSLIRGYKNREASVSLEMAYPYEDKDFLTIPLCDIIPVSKDEYMQLMLER